MSPTSPKVTNKKNAFLIFPLFSHQKQKKRDGPTESSRLISLSDGFEGEGVKKIATDYYY
jgi:hypothetical protein